MQITFEHQHKYKVFEKESLSLMYFGSTCNHIKTRSVVTKVGSFISKYHYLPSSLPSSHPSTII